MNKIILTVIGLFTMGASIYAQDTTNNPLFKDGQRKIKELSTKKAEVRQREKEHLKTTVKRIEQRLDKGEITAEDAGKLKKEAAQKRAENIEDKLDLLDLNIALIKRNRDSTDNSEPYINVGRLLTRTEVPIDSVPDLTEGHFFIDLGMGTVLNTTTGQNPYKPNFYIGAEVHLNTVLSRNDPRWRLEYGLNIEAMTFSLKDNSILADKNDKTVIEPYSDHLDYSNFSMANLTFPVMIEFGGAPIKYADKKAYYAIEDKLRAGLGGFFGFKFGSSMIYKYDHEGKFDKVTHQRSYNTHNFLYGVSGYVQYANFKLFARYNLNRIFKSAEVNGNTFTVGIGFDIFKLLNG